MERESGHYLMTVRGNIRIEEISLTPLNTLLAIFRCRVIDEIRVLREGVEFIRNKQKRSRMQKYINLLEGLVSRLDEIIFTQQVREDG